jgi:hypothetical protein
VECGGEETGGEDDSGGGEDTVGEDDAGDETGGDDEAAGWTGGEDELPPESPPEVPALTTPELVPLIPEGATYGGAERAATVGGAEVRTTNGLRLGFRLRLGAAAAECLAPVLSAAAAWPSCVAAGVTAGAVTLGRAGAFTVRLVVFPGNRVTATAAATAVAGTADASAARRGDGRRGRRRRP